MFASADDDADFAADEAPGGAHAPRRGNDADASGFEEDLALAQRIGDGDAGAIRLLIVRNQRRLFWAAWKILKDHAEADDAVQSGFANAVTAIDRYSGRSALSTWLTRIVINEALARLRKLKARAERHSDDRLLAVREYREALGGCRRDESPEAALVRGEIRVAIETAIRGLPGIFREVFLLRAVEGLSVAETAEQLGVNSATVKTRHLRARRRLQEVLSPQLGYAGLPAFSSPFLDEMMA
ncbi:MAG TPA: sigma-70 family RNA polymerase sigma factor [Allosphingosinicella sp.]|nr:sigma-70 family RNA polymerase sigma factor [Allosphingosinicella sp.]